MRTKQEMKPVIEAWLNGKEIQFQVVGEFNWIDNDLDNPDFFNTSFNWRIKPVKKLRPWKPEEVPVGALLRGDWGVAVLTHTEGEKDMMVFCAPDGSERGRKWCVAQSHTVSGMAHSTDFGKTWHPCGVEE